MEWCHDEARVLDRAVPAGHGVGRRTIRDIEWTRANLAECMPDLTSPQVLAVFEDAERAERVSLGSLAAPEAELGPVLRRSAAGLSFNLSQIRRVCRRPAWRRQGCSSRWGTPKPISAEDEIAMPPPRRRRLHGLPDFARIVWQHLRARLSFARRWHGPSISRAGKGRRPSQLTDDELWSCARGAA